MRLYQGNRNSSPEWAFRSCQGHLSGCTPLEQSSFIVLYVSCVQLLGPCTWVWLQAPKSTSSGSSFPGPAPRNRHSRPWEQVSGSSETDTRRQRRGRRLGYRPCAAMCLPRCGAVPRGPASKKMASVRWKAAPVPIRLKQRWSFSEVCAFSSAVKLELVYL